MIKNCPYFNCSLEMLPIIGCKNSTDTKQVKFPTVESRNDWIKRNCNCDFTKCRYYKTFRAKEIVENK
ncbi:MAG: hypothetical protein E7I48_17515 [Clostridium celatum]|nr:hypothetical protein [Clostridium celatum]